MKKNILFLSIVIVGFVFACTKATTNNKRLFNNSISIINQQEPTASKNDLSSNLQINSVLSINNTNCESFRGKLINSMDCPNGTCDCFDPTKNCDSYPETCKFCIKPNNCIYNPNVDITDANDLFRTTPGKTPKASDSIARTQLGSIMDRVKTNYLSNGTSIRIQVLDKTTNTLYYERVLSEDKVTGIFSSPTKFPKIPSNITNEYIAIVYKDPTAKNLTAFLNEMYKVYSFILTKDKI